MIACLKSVATIVTTKDGKSTVVFGKGEAKIVADKSAAEPTAKTSDGNKSRRLRRVWEVPLSQLAPDFSPFGVTLSERNGEALGEVKTSSAGVETRTPKRFKNLADYNQRASKLHRTAVIKALKAGESVPHSVLEEYPDLAEKYDQGSPGSKSLAKSKPMMKGDKDAALLYARQKLNSRDEFNPKHLPIDLVRVFGLSPKIAKDIVAQAESQPESDTDWKDDDNADLAENVNDAYKTLRAKQLGESQKDLFSKDDLGLPASPSLLINAGTAISRIKHRTATLVAGTWRSDDLGTPTNPRTLHEFRTTENKPGGTINEKPDGFHAYYLTPDLKAISNSETFTNLKDAKRFVETVGTDADSTLEMTTDEGNVLDTLYNENGSINYETVKDVAGRILSGEQTIVRLDPEGERGRIAGGKRNVEASILLAADGRRHQEASAAGRSGVDSHSDTVKRQERILENYAKRESIWFDYNKFFRSAKVIGRGGEAFVYRKDETRVAKIVDFRHIDKGLTPQKFLDNRISLFNHLFPESHYELMGFTRDGDGKFRFIVTQQYFDPVNLKNQADADALMKSKGFERTERESYSNDLYQVHDLHAGNVLKDANGTVYVIDAVPKMASEELYQPFSIAEKQINDSLLQPDDNQLEMAASEFDTEAFRKERDAVPLVYVKGSDTQLAAPNGKPSNLNKVQWQTVRTPAFKKYFGDWIRAFHKAFLGGRPVVSLTGDEFKSDGVPLTEKVTAWYQSEHGGSVTKPGLGEVVLNKQSVRDSLSHGLGRDKAAAFAAVPALIRDGIYLDAQSNWKGRNQDSVTIGAPIAIGGKNYVAVAIVLRDVNRNRFYLHEVVLRERLRTSFKTEASANKNVALNGEAGAIRSLLQNIFNVNEKDVSKVVDENGEPLVVKHATASVEDFDSFRITGEGTHVGTLQQAEERIGNRQGGRVMPLYASIQNPARVGDINTFSVNKLARELETQGIFSLSDVETVKTAGNRSKAFPVLRDLLEGKGYDGLVYHNEQEGAGDSYMVLRNTQLKSATGNRGSYESDNPNTLEMAATQDMSAVKHRDTGELAKAARYTQDGNLIKFDNLEAYGLTMQFLEEAFGREMTSLGITIGAKDITKLKNVLKEYLETEPLTPAEKIAMRRYIGSIEAAAQTTNGKALAFALVEAAVGEELVHSIRFAQAVTEHIEQTQSKEWIKRTTESDLFKKSTVGRNYRNQPKARQAIEFADKLMAGNFTDLGIDPVADYEPIIDAILDWANDYRATNPNVNLNDYAKINATTAYFTQRISEADQRNAEARKQEAESAVSEREPEPQRTRAPRSDSSDTGPAAERVEGGQAAPSDEFKPGGETKLSQTPKSLRNKANIPLEDRTYTSVTNAEQQAFADTQLDKGIDEATKWFNDNAADNNLNSGATAAVGLNLMNQLGKNRDIAAMNAIADKLVPLVTEAAQTVQAMSIVSLFNPATAGAYAAQNSQTANRQGLVAGSIR